MPDFDALNVTKNHLIRRAKAGAVVVAEMSAPIPTSLTSGTDAGLITLDPQIWKPVGWMTTDGVTYERTTESTDTNSFGSREPTRSDVTRDEINMNFTAQETKLLTIGLTTGAELAAIKANATTGEVIIDKPDTPRLRFYRALGIFLDHNDDGEEIYFGRLMPRAQIGDFGSQSYNEDENGINYALQWRGKKDETAGFSHRWFWGGPGWKSLLTEMSIPTLTP
jgi:hypothetical protein